MDWILEHNKELLLILLVTSPFVHQKYILEYIYRFLKMVEYLKQKIDKC